MKKNIYFHYGYKTDYETRIKRIVEAGFDGVFLFDHEMVGKLIEPIRQAGLEIESLHLAFDGCNALWIEGEEGDRFVESTIEGIRRAGHHHVPAVIFHVSSKVPPAFSQIGIDRMHQILDVCEQEQVVLALENLRRLDFLEKIYASCSSKWLKFCYDSGHASAFTKNVDDFPWNIYGPYLHCVHLHDNDGRFDLHLLPYTKKIDWKTIAKQLVEVGFQGPLTLEGVNKHQLEIEEHEYVVRAKQAIDRFEMEMRDLNE